MGYWGVRSYENDEADFALDAGFDRVHGAAYEALMDDGNPLTLAQVQEKLANPATLAAAVEHLRMVIGRPCDDWDETEQLGFVGIIVRHAELGVPIPADWRDQAVTMLREETAEWDEATLRQLRVQHEIELLTRSKPL